MLVAADPSSAIYTGLAFGVLVIPPTERTATFQVSSGHEGVHLEFKFIVYLFKLAGNAGSSKFGESKQRD